MSRPQGNGLFEMVDDREKKDKGFFCMTLVGFILQESEEMGTAVADIWDRRFKNAKQGCCSYRHECPVYERTMAKRQKAETIEKIQSGQMEIQW